MKKKFKVKEIVVVALLAILVFGSLYALNGEKKTTDKEIEKVYIGMDTEKPAENFSKADAVDSLKTILESVEADVDGKERSIEDRIKALDKESVNLEDVVNKKTISGLYLSEEFKESEFNTRFAASALLTYYQVAISSNDEKAVSVLANKDELEEIVYMDSKLMSAQIPIDVFIGENRGISFEMQYINGEWKLNPYSAMMSLVMIVNYEKQIASEEK